MYKVHFIGFFGVRELNRIFKSKIIALITAMIYKWWFNEICDYEIIEVQNGKRKRKQNRS